MSNTNLPLWPGWETVRLIGKGSFGAVYEIQRDMLGDIEKAALKVISIPQNDSDIEELYSDGFDEESITSTFRNHLKSIISEYSMMRKMNGCSNIVSCDDVRYVQHDDGIGWDIFIKMELLTALHKALPAEIPEKMVIDIGKGICTALELCKKYDIVHRDIKPQNIFISPNGDYKLGDFGIAKTVEKTTGGTKIGTYKYMAPEVYNNKPYGSSADIYSLGLVLYWLLNERRMPFLPLPPQKLTTGMDEEARRRRLSGEALPAPAHGSDALKAIVLKACAYQPQDRFTSAAEMLDELDQLDNAPSGSAQKIQTHDNAASGAQEDQTMGVWGANSVSNRQSTVQEAKAAMGMDAPDAGSHTVPVHQASTIGNTKEDFCKAVDEDATAGVFHDIPTGNVSRISSNNVRTGAAAVFTDAVVFPADDHRQNIPARDAAAGLFSYSGNAGKGDTKPVDEDATIGVFQNIHHIDAEPEKAQPPKQDAARTYNRALGIMRSGTSALYFEEAARLFRSIADYRDAAALAAQCLANAKAAKNDAILAKADAIIGEGSEFAPAYETAITLYESIPGWKDADAKLRVCRARLSAIRNQVNTAAKKSEQTAAPKKGAKRWMLLLVGLVGLAVLGVIIYFLVNANAVKPGDTITFGRYEQDNNTNNGAEPIEWVVLDVEGGKALVVSKYIVDTSIYHSKNTPVTWLTSDIRRWLNGGFFPTTFSPAEQAQVITTKLSAVANSQYGNPNLYSSNDKVFLLSAEEVDKYWTFIHTLPCTQLKSNTPYSWWLRTPGSTSFDTVVVDGSFLLDQNAYANERGVRPAMWITLP